MKDQSGLYKNRPASKFIPAKASDPSKGDDSGMKNTEDRRLGGDASHDFNYKAKVKNMGNNYHGYGDPQAGLGFNGQDKDASLAYLKDRNEKGQRVRNFSGGNEMSRLHTYNGGVTAYNNNPIKEVYKPATSQNVPPEQAIKYSTITKTESPEPGNQTKIGKQIRDSKAKKG